MNIEDEIFKKSKVNFNKLLDYGFTLNDNLYKFTKYIMDNTFMINVFIDKLGKVIVKVYDLSMDDEYTSFRIKDNNSSFANIIKNEIIILLNDIKDNCFINNDFINDQTNQIAALIKDKYNINPEFLWENPNYAVFRNKINNKWYSIIMDINKSKLDNKSNVEVEIINIKLDPNKIENLLKKNGYYKAYHMNKKYWISIVLDKTISSDIIIDLINESYNLSLKK